MLFTARTEEEASMTEYLRKTVYLSGPITGLSYAEARASWRHEAAALLNPHIDALSPMRAKEFLKGKRKLAGGFDIYPDKPLARPKGILTRDTNDVRTADVILVYLKGAEKVSIGTVHEIGMAHVLGKPIVLVMEKGDKNVHSHAFVTESAGYWVDDLAEGVNIVNSLLTPGV